MLQLGLGKSTRVKVSPASSLTLSEDQVPCECKHKVPLHLSQGLSLLGATCTPEPSLELLIQLRVAQGLAGLGAGARCVLGMGSTWDLLGMQDGAMEGLGLRHAPTQARPQFCEFSSRLCLLSTHLLSFRYKA